MYAGLFLPEHDPHLIDALKRKAKAGTKITVLLGDPDCDAVAVRGREEGTGDALAAKIRNVMSFYEKLKGTESVFVGFHSVTLYNSIYRYDDEMLVNTTSTASRPLMRPSCTCADSPVEPCSTPTLTVSTESGRLLATPGPASMGR